MHRSRAMGCDVAVTGGDPAAVAGVLERWEETFSLFRPDLGVVARERVDCTSASVSGFFASTLKTALDVAAETDGLVDPTLCGRWREVAVSGRVLFRPPGLALDLNGVVKALAVDEAVAALDGPGFVSVGGDLAVRGPVDVALPAGGAIRVVAGGLATSGTATRGAHLVNPATGLPSESRWEQVTASGVTCLAADIAAKAGFLLGEDGPAWLDERGIPGRFVAARRRDRRERHLGERERGGGDVHVSSSPAIWYAARASGVAAYVVLSIVVSSGWRLAARRRTAAGRASPWRTSTASAGCS